MNSIQSGFRSSVCRCVRQLDEEPVQNGLSYTPAQMRDMTQKGYPVAPPALSEDFFQDSDNRAGNNFDIDIWERRGVSINDVWETQQDSRSKIKKVHSQGVFETVKNDE